MASTKPMWSKMRFRQARFPDLALGIGGLPRGRVVEISTESSGTTVALHSIAEARSWEASQPY